MQFIHILNVLHKIYVCYYNIRSNIKAKKKEEKTQTNTNTKTKQNLKLIMYWHTSFYSVSLILLLLAFYMPIWHFWSKWVIDCGHLRLFHGENILLYMRWGWCRLYTKPTRWNKQPQVNTYSTLTHYHVFKPVSLSA